MKGNRNRDSSPQREPGSGNNKQDNKQQKIHPTQDVGNATDSGGSMSEGNLVNDRFSRQRGRSLQDKSIVLGSDTDGQAT